MIDNLEYRVAKLRLAPGDVLVVKAAFHVSSDLGKRIREHFAKALPAGTSVFVIGEDIDLSVLTRDEIETLSAASAQSRSIGDAIAVSRKAQTRYP